MKSLPKPKVLQGEVLTPGTPEYSKQITEEIMGDIYVSNVREIMRPSLLMRRQGFTKHPMDCDHNTQVFRTKWRCKDCGMWL